MTEHWPIKFKALGSHFNRENKSVGAGIRDDTGRKGVIQVYYIIMYKTVKE